MPSWGERVGGEDDRWTGRASWFDPEEGRYEKCRNSNVADVPLISIRTKRLVLGIEWLSKAALGDEIPCVPSSTTFVAASSHNGSLCSDEKHMADRKFKPDFRHRRCPGF